MVRLCAKVPQMIFMGIYIYLALPVVIFLLGWLKLPIGIPAAVLVAAGAFLCYREHDFNAAGHVEFSGQDLLKCIAAIAIVVIWVFFSGVGKYVWQNSDHYVRNEIFNVMTEKSWPVYSDTPEGVPLVYYIGFWLPSAVIGKVFGLQAGYFAQAVWAVIGILLCFALICIKRNKISIWPLLVFMGFSGLDAIGSILMHKDTFQIFGTSSRMVNSRNSTSI